MKKAFVAILFFLVFSAAANADFAAAPPKPGNAGKPWFPWFRWGHPLPPMPPLDPKVQKCLGDMAGLRNCMHQIHSSFESQKIALSPECCNAVQQMSADCANTVFGRFNNPFFQIALKLCAAPPA